MHISKGYQGRDKIQCRDMSKYSMERKPKEKVQ